MCNKLPTKDIIYNIDDVQLTLVRRTHHSVLTTQKAKYDATLPDMKVPKLTPTTFEDLHTSFNSVVGRQESLSGISFDYLLHPNSLVDFILKWTTREEILSNCISLTGQRLKQYSEPLYSLLVQQIFTVRCCSKIVTKYKHFNNGRT